MEAAVGMAAGKIATKLLDLLVSNHNLRADLEHDIQYIKKEFLMICAAIREDEARRERGGCGSNEVETAWIQMVRDLAHAIEDCIDRFMHRVTLKTDASWIRKKLHRVRTVPARNKFAAAIRRLRKKSEEASELRKKYNREYGDGGCVGAGSSTMERKRSGPTIKYLAATPIEEDISDEETDTDTCMAVGMEAPLDDLMDLIRETQGETLNELKVISLVGFGGIGKTRLARHVYSSPVVVNQYQPRAWVRASEKDAVDVLREILRQIGMRSTIAGRGGSTGRLRKIRTSLRECLGSKRFFIVIDDMRDEFWHQIKDAFPVVPGVSSRIMVTTALRSVAKACSSSRGHAYMMRTLAKEHSRQLFFREASLEDPPPPGDQTQLATSEALIKCDGLPLALLTTAMFFQSGGDPANWADLSENLGKYLETKKTLARMKRVLVYSYTSLGSQQVKTCLLYMGIYPSGRPISKGSLIRRWLAEGFIQGDIKQGAIKAATSTFDELVNRSIIQPNDGSSNMNSAEVKTCQTHGMMIEFILHKSTCENFVTLLYDEAPLHSNIRWLSLHHKSAKSARMNPKDLHLVRSLTVFGKAHNSMLDFSKYELLRVLDLEQCSNDLEKKHIKQICKLLLLRYLSLGASVKVKVLPKEIKKLQLLETLDIRRTIIEILPTQIMKLPCLIHMFGRFKLQHNIGGRRMRKLHAFMSKKSKLETVAGFVVDDKSQGSAQLVEHMKHLTKMKIWCKYTADARSNLTHLSEAIKGFIARGTNSNSSLSLSLNFNDEWSHNMLMNLSLEKEKDSSCYLSSLKLQGGKICSLPPFVTMMGGITKLCLSSPYHQLSSDILVALSSVRHLEYLKLVASKLTKVVIGHVGFESLRHLCIMVEVMAELEIKEEALPFLESLRLLSNDQNGFRGTIIQSLLCLKEVALYDGVNDKTKQEWKEAAKKHPRCPRLLFVEMKQMESEPDLEIFTAGAATNTMTEEVDVENELEMKINSMASPTTVMLSVTRPPDAISTRESVQVDGNGQHDDDDDDDDDGEDDDYNDSDDDDDNDDDDDDEKEVMDETEIFAEKNGPISEVIYPMNKECSIESTKGEKCSWG